MKKRVILLENRVIKRFDDPGDYLREKQFYLTAPPFAPKLLQDNQKDALVLERVPGIPFHKCPHPDYIMAGKLLGQMHAFQPRGRLVLSKGNADPHSFLQGVKRGWLIDFSQVSIDFPEPDISLFLLHMASTLLHSDFIDACRQFLHGYTQLHEGDPHRWLSLLPNAIVQFDERERRFEDNPAVPADSIQQNRQFLAQEALYLLRS